MLVIRRSIIYANKFIPISIVDFHILSQFGGGHKPSIYRIYIYIYVYVYIYIYMVNRGFAPPTKVTQYMKIHN